MEKQYDLCLEVLRRLNKAGVLNRLIVIGSWCIYFYKSYFSDVDYSSSIRTRDIDFVVPIPVKFRKKTNIPELLKDLGFIVDFHAKGEEGIMKRLFETMPKKWRTKVIKTLDNYEQKNIIDLLS